MTQSPSKMMAMIMLMLIKKMIMRIMAIIRIMIISMITLALVEVCVNLHEVWALAEGIDVTLLSSEGLVILL